ncbi:MAG: hypothetical protein L6R30_27170 [Thermoanaerobaculia bacterium]|nr:hypothetical protein [Thermoanaerobaculia bacterium]
MTTAMRVVSEAPWLKDGEWREVGVGRTRAGVKTFRPGSSENAEAKYDPSTDVVLLLGAYSDSAAAKAEIVRREASIPRQPIRDLVIEAADEVFAWGGFARKDQVVIHLRVAQFVVSITAPDRKTAEFVARNTAQTISRLAILKK